MQRKISRTDTAEDEKKRAQEQYMRGQQACGRQLIEAQRKLCTHLRFWHLCADRRCGRARQCAGNAEACFNRFWPHVPEDLKNEIRQTIRLANEAMPPRAAAAAASGYAARRKRIEDEALAREAARRAAPVLPEPAPITITRTQTPARHAGPRIGGM
jgi:hypothetical protein